MVSVIPSSELSALTKTVDWINGNYTPSHLPKGRFLFTYHFFSTQPSLNIYIRKSEDKRLPHLFFEFKYTALVFVFVVPMSAKDELDFVDEDDFEESIFLRLWAKRAGKFWIYPVPTEKGLSSR